MKLKFLKAFRFSQKGHKITEVVEGDIVEVEREAQALRFIKEKTAEDVSEAFKPDENDEGGDEDEADDLTVVTHIGPKTEEKINAELDVWTLDELSELLETETGKARVGAIVSGDIDEVIEGLKEVQADREESKEEE